MPSTIAIVIPTYESATVLPRAIESVLAQRRAPDLVIVVDDGSTDGTAEVVGRYGARVRYLRQENAGVAVARNNGLAAADTDYVAFLDADDTLLPPMTATLGGALDGHPEAVAASGAFFYVTPQGRLRRPIEAPCPPGSALVLPDVFETQRTQGIMAMGAILFRRDAVVRVGGFKRGLRFGQDVHLHSRVAGQGAWVFCNTAVFEYHHTPVTSRTLRTPPAEQGLGFLLTDDEVERWLPARLRGSYRRLSAEATTRRAREYLSANRCEEALATLRRVPWTRRSTLWFSTHCLARLPSPATAGWLRARAGVRRQLQRLGLR